LRAVLAAGQIDIGDLGDHVAGAVDLHPVADADVLAAADHLAPAVAAGDVILVVQGRVRDHDAAHRHRLQPRDGRERAGAADLDVDAQKLGPGQFGRELVRDGPAGRGGAEAEPGLQRKVVHLVDHAVDVIAQRRALRLDQAVVGQHFLRAGAEDGQGIGLEPQGV
jgi:hypothetical protein